MLRVIARSLILWDEVLPTRKWIDDQIPTVVFTAYNEMRESVEKATDFSDISGRNSARLGPSSTNHGAAASEMSHLGASRNEQNFDRQAVRQIYCHVVAAACFGIGLRFAGTGDKRAASAITETLKDLRFLRDENDPVAVALRPERQVLEMCLGCAAISLALVLAGKPYITSAASLVTIR
jgi:anaphase-promoting complex subunit 1